MTVTATWHRRVRRVRWRLLAVLPAFLLVSSELPGCKQAADGQPHAGGAQAQRQAASRDLVDAHDDGTDHPNEASGETAHLDEVTISAEAIRHYGIAVARAEVVALQPTLIAPARVAFNSEAIAHVGSPLRGRVVETKVRVGDLVKIGQELLVVECPELGEAQAELLQRRSAIQAAGPAVELSKIAWDRAKGLHDRSQGIALSEVQRREAEYHGTLASLRAAEAAAMAAENRLHLLGMAQEQVDALTSTGSISARFMIGAPIDGTVVRRAVTLGELVGPERESLLVLADTRTLWVLAEVPEAQLQLVASGAKAWVAVGPAGAGRFEGKVAFISATVDSGTRTASVRIEVPGAAMAMKPGMFAQVEIAEAVDHGVPTVAVPEDAVQTVEGGPAVFVPVKDEPNTYAKRAVKVGKPVGGLVPVLEGLAPGEEFVAAGTFILKAELGKGSAAHEH